jgi:hypothetical protein
MGWKKKATNNVNLSDSWGGNSGWEETSTPRNEKKSDLSNEIEPGEIVTEKPPPENNKPNYQGQSVFTNNNDSWAN